VNYASESIVASFFDQHKIFEPVLEVQMAGKSKTPAERAYMLKRCEDIAVKYRGTGTYTDPSAEMPNYENSLPPDMQRQIAAAKEQPSAPTEAEVERAAARRKEFYQGTEPQY
jgi:hypothetical protein